MQESKIYVKSLVPENSTYTQQITHTEYTINVGISNVKGNNKVLTIFQLKNGDYKIRVK